MLLLSEFSVTPDVSPSTNSLNDEGVGDRVKEVHSPDNILMDIAFPSEQLRGYQVQDDIPIPFPPTPEPTEMSQVSAPLPLIKPNSYRNIQDSTYFQEMVKRKTTKKLTEKDRQSLLAGKQAYTPQTEKAIDEDGREEDGEKGGT